MRKYIYSLLIFIIAMVGIVGCEKNINSDMMDTSKSPDKIVLGLQKSITPELIVRYEKKYEEYLGKNVEIVQFDSGAGVNTALASGSIDIGMMGTSVVATSLSNNLDIKVIWMNNVIGSAESLIVKEDSGINNMEGLKEKRIATPFVSTAHYSLQSAIKNAGIQMTDIELFDMQPADILAAWEREDIDGAYVWYPVLGELIRDNGIIITTSEEQAKNGIITADVTVVRSEFADQYPEVVKNYIKAQIYAVNMFKNERDKAVEAIAKAADISVEEASEQVKGFEYPTAEEQIDERYLGRTNQVGQMVNVLKDTATFLKEQGNIPEICESKVFEDAVTSKYIEMALEEIGN